MFSRNLPYLNKISKQETASLKVLSLFFNTMQYPMEELFLRKALVAAIECEKIVCDQNPIPFTLSFKQAQSFFDLALFQLQLIKTELPSIALFVSENQEPIAHNLKEQWKEKLGIYTTIHPDHKYHCTLTEWEVPTSDLLSTLSLFKNVTPHYENCLKVAKQEQDLQKKQVYIEGLMDLLADHVSIFPLFYRMAP